MKSILTLVLVVRTSALFAQVNFPDPSPLQTIRQNFGMSAIEVTYSRPSAKGRQIIGNLEPHGRVWRTGANAPTKIRFYSRVEVAGNAIDTGTYVLYTIPTENEWTIILNRGTKNWGSDGYRAEDDVCRFTVSPERKRPMVETMAIQFENVTGTSCELTLSWEDWKISIPIVAPLMNPLRQQIEANLKTAQPQYWLAAQFYFEYEKDNAKALNMIESAISANEAAGRNPYWQYFYKARILRAMGKNKEAIEMAQLTARYAAAQGNRSNYVKQAEDLIQSIQKK